MFYPFFGKNSLRAAQTDETNCCLINFLVIRFTEVGGVATCAKWKNKMIRHAELVSASVPT